MGQKVKSCFSLVLLLLSGFVSAFTFQPMFAYLSTSGANSIRTFTIHNDSSEILPVKFTIVTRSVDSDGKETNADARGLFAIYPARVVVEPNSSASVKIQWKGSLTLDAEQTFRLIAESVPLNTGSSGTSGIKVMFRYIASIYVGSAEFSADLICTVLGSRGPNGENGLTVKIMNRGKRHVISERLSLSVNIEEGRKTTFEGLELGLLSGSNYLPGCELSVFIPQSKAVPGKLYDAQIQYESVY